MLGAMEAQQTPGGGQPQPPGWHEDPWQPGAQRWWDGTQWTQQTQAPQAAASPVGGGYGVPVPDLDGMPAPYHGNHEGPRRTLTLTMRSGVMQGMNWVSNTTASVNIDGSVHKLPFGTGTALFEVPADRPVHVSVEQVSMGATVGVATIVLMPQAPPELEYRGPAYKEFSGQIGPPGTVRSRGKGLQFTLFGCLGFLLFVSLFVLVLLLSA